MGSRLADASAGHVAGIRMDNATSVATVVEVSRFVQSAQLEGLLYSATSYSWTIENAS